MTKKPLGQNPRGFFFCLISQKEKGVSAVDNNFGFSEDLLSSHTEQEEQIEVDQLIFPLNVHESMKSAGGLNKGEKTAIIISFWLFGCALLGWFLMSWLKSLSIEHYVLLTALVELLLQLTVGVYILRFALDERAMFQELNNANTSFAQYFKIYKELTVEGGSPLPFDVLEFSDGSWGAFLQLRLGFNTNARSANTYHANKAVINILNKSNLAHKTIYHNEEFKNSLAAEDLRAVLGNIKDPKLFETYRSVVQNYLDIAEDQSNVLCTTYVIYAQNRIQKDEFVATMNSIISALTKHETVYREISILKYDGIVSFLQNYYRLEVLDMGLVRANTVLTKKKFSSSSVRVLKIYGASGKIYASPEFKQLRNEIMREGGLGAHKE